MDEQKNSLMRVANTVKQYNESSRCGVVRLCRAILVAILCMIPMGVVHPQLSASSPGAALPTLAAVSPTEVYNWQGTDILTGTATVADTVVFTTTGSMANARYHHRATLLTNGRVLITGGIDDSDNRLASAELYDPATGAFTAVASAPTPRYAHSETLLPSGKVLIAGGHTGYGGLAATVDIYDPATDTFTSDDMLVGRSGHTTTLLPNGKVLIATGWNTNSAELYDPATGTSAFTGSLANVRQSATATLLPNGTVLIAGGDDPNLTPGALSSAELYDPAAGAFIATGSMATARHGHVSVLLQDGKALIAGGQTSAAELYDPATGTFTRTGSMAGSHYEGTATLLQCGKVLISGGTNPELYDPATGTFTLAGSLVERRETHTATLLQDGRALLTGGNSATGHKLESAEIGTYIPSNAFTGTLTLPSGWVNLSTIDMAFVGSTADAALDAGALSNNGTAWGEWTAATAGTPVTTTWNLGSDGYDKPVYLRLRDENGQMAMVVTGTVKVDTTPPSSSMLPLPVTSPSAVSLSWSGSDGLSGVESYDLQVRIGATGGWTSVLTGTMAGSTTYNGTSGSTYYFRVRATDAAGNVESWPDTYDTFTLVDTEIPTGSLIVNSGALATPSRDVILTLSANDVLGSVATMSFSNDRNAWSDWQPYAWGASWSLSTGDGLKTACGRFKDTAGNVSSIVSDTIELDTKAGTDYRLTINDGALFTNEVTVTLTIGAQPGTARMQVSNDGGFAGAEWEPYASRKTWQITRYGGYVIPRVVYVRYQDINGNTSATYQDDIILDVNSPTGSVEIVPLSSSSHRLRSTNVISVTLHLSAEDDESGVADMMISNRSDFVSASWEPFATARSWSVPEGALVTVYVRFRDNAGNVSETYSDVTGQTHIYLPLVTRSYVTF